MATALNKSIYQDLSVLATSHKVKFPSNKVLRKYVQRFTTHNLAQPKVLHKDTFILVKLPSPTYADILASTEPHRWVVGKITDVFDNNMVNIEITTDKAHQLVVYLKKNTGWSELPYLLTSDYYDWVDQLLRGQEDVMLEPVKHIVDQQDLVTLMEDNSIIVLLKNNSNRNNQK